MTPICFDVIGLPGPQGSKRAFLANGKAMMTDSGGKRSIVWRDSVASTARDIAKVYGCLDGPLRLQVHFRFPMPKSRPKATRATGTAWKTTAPDSSKLLRALEDGLQAGGLIRDDARIAYHLITKTEVLEGWTGASINLSILDPQEQQQPR